MLRLQRIFAFTALVIWAALPASALDPGRRLTQYLQRIWQARQGLPQSGIFAIHQTRDGYLWLGTGDGLVRFDGVRFTSPEDLDGLALPKMSVRQLAEDSRGALWIATSDSGLFRIEKGTVARFSQRDGLPAGNVACLFPGQGGDLWACSEGGLAQIKDGKIRLLGNAPDLAGGSTAAAAQRKDGTIWMGGDGPELSIWTGAQFNSYSLHTLPRYARIQAMLSGSDNTLWIGTTAGLIRLEEGREQCFTKADGLANDSVLSLAEGRNGSIWIGTDGGFSRWRNGEIESFLPKNGLSQSTVGALYEDREGSLWVGTKRGLNQFVDRRTLPFTTAEGLPSNDTGPVFQDPRGVIWVGTLGAGLARFDKSDDSARLRAENLICSLPRSVKRLCAMTPILAPAATRIIRGYHAHSSVPTTDPGRPPSTTGRTESPQPQRQGRDASSRQTTPAPRGPNQKEVGKASSVISGHSRGGAAVTGEVQQHGFHESSLGRNRLTVRCDSNRPSVAQGRDAGCPNGHHSSVLGQLADEFKGYAMTKSSLHFPCRPSATEASRAEPDRGALAELREASR